MSPKRQLLNLFRRLAAKSGVLSRLQKPSTLGTF